LFYCEVILFLYLGDLIIFNIRWGVFQHQSQQSFYSHVTFAGQRNSSWFHSLWAYPLER